MSRRNQLVRVGAAETINALLCAHTHGGRLTLADSDTFATLMFSADEGKLSMTAVRGATTEVSVALHGLRLPDSVVNAAAQLLAGGAL